MFRHGLVTLAVSVCLTVPLSARAAPGAPDVIRSTVPLPGGAATLSEALGSPRTFDRAFVLLEGARLLHENPPGESPETDRRRRQFMAYVSALREGKRSARGGDETVPMPLTSATWSDAVFGRRMSDRELAWAILEDRQASLLYVGLSALDDETLRLLASDRKTLEILYRQQAAVLAAFAGSFRVRDGVVVVPGGEAARPLWEALAGQPISAPVPFLLAILGGDAGRLAFFYDTASELGEPARRYMLALDQPAETRLPSVQALYRVFAISQLGWQVTRRPYTRASMDGSLLFREIRLDASGRPVGPLWPSVLGGALADLPRVPGGMGGGPWLPEDPVRDVASMDPSRQVDAAWLADRILTPLPQVGRQRLDAVLFGQRVFPTPDPKEAADILLALRGRIVFPTLVMTLERMGVRDASLYARAVRLAARFIEVTHPGYAVCALAQLQASLVILEHSVRERVIAPETALALTRSLLALEPDDTQSYRGAIARWFDEALLPVLWQATGESVASSSAELAALRGIAGDVPWPERPPVTVVWEGRSYHVNRGVAELSRLRALRESQGGPTLDQVLAFCRAVADGLVKESPDESLIADVVAVREALRGLGSPEIGARARSSVPDAEELTLTAILRANARDREGALAALRPLVSYGDALLADVLTSIVYVLHLGSPDSPALAGGNVALRHDFQLELPRTTPWQVAPGWTMPTEDPTGGWHVTGSLLLLDLGLARFSLRWLSADALPSMPYLNANERHTFAESVVLANILTFQDTDRDRLVDAMERGRQRVAALAADPASVDEVAADARLGGLRREALRWMIVNDPQSTARSLSLLEQLWLGGGAALALDAWGTSALPTLGCACPVFPAPDAWEVFTGRPASGLIGTRMPDLSLRIAQELHARSLPAALAPGLLAVAMTDLLHEAPLAHHDDWLAVVRYVRALPADRFVDYVSSLTAAGPLVPAEAGDDGEGSR